MRLVLSSMGLALGALTTLALGVWFAAWVGLEVRRAFGQEWEMLAYVAALLLMAGIAAALYRWQDALMGMLGQVTGQALPDVLYCQTCGQPAAPAADVCRACGGTRFALSVPGAGGRTRWHVQVGMDVLGADERPIGVVKRRRREDFLVARERQRDVYVPLSAIAGATTRRIHLCVAADSVDGAGWTRPALLGGAAEARGS